MCHRVRANGATSATPGTMPSYDIFRANRLRPHPGPRRRRRRRGA